MVRDIMGLMEIISLLFILAAVYNEKFKCEIYEVIFIISELIFISGINNHGWPSYLASIFYVFLFCYALLNYKASLRKTLLNCVIAYIITGIVQLVSYWIVGIILEFTKASIGQKELVVTIAYTVIIIIFSNKLHLNDLSNFFVRRNKLVCIIGVFVLVLLGSQAWIIKRTHTLDAKYVLVSISFVILLLVLVMEWQKSRIDAGKRKTQLELNKLYYSAYEELIQSMREKQHDYKNHINAMQGILYSTDNCNIAIEELKKYLGSLTNKVDNLRVLTMVENPLIAGFINYEITRAINMGVDVKQSCVMPNISIKIPECQIVEMLGILLDNAIEAMNNSEEKKMIIELRIDNQKLVFSVQNSCKNVTSSDFRVFFKNGYSTKGVNRGIGLAKLKNMVEQNGVDVHISSEELGHESMINIEVTINV